MVTALVELEAGAAAPSATRAVVADPPGEPTTLTMHDESGAIATLTLGPAECIALASDLLNAARRRIGRGPAAGSV